MNLSQPARQSEFEKSAQKRARTSKIEREILKIDYPKRTKADMCLNAGKTILEAEVLFSQGAQFAVSFSATLEFRR